MLIREAQRTRQVLIDLMEIKYLGSVSNTVERVVSVLGPRYKRCSQDVHVGGRAEFKAASVDQVKKGAACLFVSTVSALNSTGSGPNGEIITPPPAAKKAKLSTLGQGCRLVPMLQPAVGILLEAVGEAARAYT